MRYRRYIMCLVIDMLESKIQFKGKNKPQINTL